MKWNDPEHEMFVRYANRESYRIQIQVLLNLPADACEELVKLMEEEVSAWVMITKFSFVSIWEPSWQHALLMMAMGEWRLDVWQEYVLDLVLDYQRNAAAKFFTFASSTTNINWDDIEEIAWA